MSILWKETLIKIKDLRDCPYNPRRISKKSYDLLVKSVRKSGYNQRIVVDFDCTILSGHQRRNALLDAGYRLDDAIPCLRPDRLLTSAEAKNILLNSNGVYGEFDTDLLANNFDEEILKDSALPESILKEIEGLEGSIAKEIEELEEEDGELCKKCPHR